MDSGAGLHYFWSQLHHETYRAHALDSELFSCNNDPNSLSFNKEALTKAQSCALICKSDIDLVDTNTKEADPSKFKDEHKWPEWSKAFMNYLSLIPGVNGVSLTYVVCEEDEPEDSMEYLTFNE